MNEYGMQPDMIGRWKRRMFPTDAPTTPEPEWSEYIEPDALTVETIPQARPHDETEEPEEDYTNTEKWLEVRTKQWDTLTETNTKPALTRYLISNRYTTSYRLRTEADGAVLFVVEQADIPALISPETIRLPGWRQSEGVRLPYPVNHLDTTQSGGDVTSDSHVSDHPAGAGAFSRWARNGFGRPRSG